MKKIYFDNASTTAIRPEVIAEMTRSLQEDFGNPSSTHSYGRSSKTAIETARKNIAKQINATAQEIIFTSGGTEANNLVLRSAVENLGIERIITSKIEHHAVLHTVEALQKTNNFQIDFVELEDNGNISLSHLEKLLEEKEPTLVSLMHVNNETGNILDIGKVAKICQQNQALFHSDTVQSVGKTAIDLQEIPIDFMVASAHKFHGPKGIGFLFVRKNTGLQPIIFGGEQEKGLRAGTESVHNIVGMAKALEISVANLGDEKAKVFSLKKYLIEKLSQHFPDAKINGHHEGFYNIVNVLLPFTEDKTAMILFNLDMKGIAVSRGSACQSGSIKPSHVLQEILPENEILKPSLRISFSHENTLEEIDFFVEALKAI
ncbi:aminotransferase class V-fold PLP-dependent enzyme [Flavobacterium sp. NST-5]|uniref:cysteine desulfurase n=1 Tax=Flavobacterium ichthyis TaxID=2698827 RepID=A0ABW9Z8V8_9FLAO|nr:cysteine desulfurase family protein [Flavobacterium ichthyis]NBL64234.1 aminotransferase class V-fold PLP-dependent enzyme [Flavobacterium ichthyis]